MSKRAGSSYHVPDEEEQRTSPIKSVNPGSGGIGAAPTTGADSL